MSLEYEAMKAVATEKQMEKEMMDTLSDPVLEPEGPGLSFDFSFLKAKTGEGSIEDYLNHPLNIKRSRGVAQMLRGVTGMLGDLDLAVVDIVMGGFNMIREGREGANYDKAGE